MTARPPGVLPEPPKIDLDTFILPHSLEAERAALGAAMINPRAADYLTDRVPAEAFFRRANQGIFLAIRQLREQERTVDFVTLKEQLARVGKLDEVGGPIYLSALMDGVPQSTNVAHYADILRDLQARRAVYTFAMRTIDLVGAGTHGAQAILNDTDRRLMDLQAGHVGGRMQAVSERIGAISADLEWRMAHRGELTGVETGYPSINEMTLGWQPGDLIILGARPSIGKTTFVLNSAVHAGPRFHVAIFSLEMRREQLEHRMLSQLSLVPLTRILNGYLTEGDMPKMSQAMEALAALHISIDDRAGQTVGEIRGACRRLKAEQGLDLVVIDYIQLMPGTLERRGATRNEEIADISARLKRLAGELAVPVIALSQLSRKASDRYDPTPKLHDLRESGALEQDADVVAFLHRKSHREGGTTKFILEKMRNGPTGTLNLTLDRDITTFTDGGEEPAPEPKAEKTSKSRRRST